MNKTKMILAGTGGVIGLVVLVLAFLVWQGFSAKTAAIEGDDEEGVDGYETVVGRAETLSRKPVYPSAAGVTAIESNRTVLTEWTADARKLASRGDRTFGVTTPAAFKAFIVGNVAMLREGTNATARILKPDFAFGPFKDYIAEGKLPAENELAELQRKWDDVVTVTELLAESGVSELVDVQFINRMIELSNNRNESKSAKKAKPAKKGASKSNNQTVQQSNVSFSYAFTFTARPAALVKVVNALGTCERFIVVEDFTFARPGDVIAEALGGEEKKEAALASGGRRGRRGRRGAEAPASKLAGTETENGKNGVVTDPLLDAPLSVVMTVTVHDFRSLEEEEEGK